MESEGHLDICSRCKKQMTFSGPNKYCWDKGFIFGADPSSTSQFCLAVARLLGCTCSFFLLLSTGSTQEDRKLSRHD